MVKKTPEEVISRSEKSSKSVFECFGTKGMKTVPKKCHMLLCKNKVLRQILMKIGLLIQDLKKARCNI